MLALNEILRDMNHNSEDSLVPCGLVVTGNHWSVQKVALSRDSHTCSLTSCDSYRTSGTTARQLTVGMNNSSCFPDVIRFHYPLQKVYLIVSG